ncbi:MAG: hypothetical protein R6U36_08540 [Candidatus Fermentibacteraceae bacterium]
MQVFMIIAILAPASLPAPDSPLRLPLETSEYCRTLQPLAGGVAYVDSSLRPKVLSPDSLLSHPLELDWGPAEDGWDWSGEVMLLESSPDGSLVCLGLCVGLSDSLRPAGHYAMDPLLLVVCGADGSDARPVGLTLLVGRGPGFEFTADSRFLYGSPLLDCDPHPREYRSTLMEGMPSSSDEHLIEVAGGARSGSCAGLLADGFLPSPWSDLAAAGACPPDLIVDVTSGEVLVEDTTGCGILYEWVLPDAGLAREGHRQVLRFADGGAWTNPGEELRVHLRLDDGRYLFSRGPSSDVLLGEIDWHDFSADGAVGLPGLTEGMVDGVVTEAGEPGMILFVEDGAVWVYRSTLLCCDAGEAE